MQAVESGVARYADEMTSTPNDTRHGRTRFASTGPGTRIAYDPGLESRASDPLPTPVVLLHPLLGDRASLNGLRDALSGSAGCSRRVIVPEARGHGASAALANRRLSLTDLAADVLAVLDAESIVAVHLIGEGLGGATAFELARRRPDRVRSLTLITPPLWGLLAGDADPAVRAAGEATRRVARQVADLADRGQTDRALDLYLDDRLGPGWRERTERSRLGRLRRHAGALAAALTALDSYLVTPDDVRGIVTPTLLLSSDDPTQVDRLVIERLAAGLPGSHVATTIPDSGEAVLHDRVIAFVSMS
jgi:pimeloyl-ACP methyl ester carboxylesterase